MRYLFLWVMLLSSYLLTAQINYGLTIGVNGSHIELTRDPIYPVLGLGLNGRFFANRVVANRIIIEVGAGLSQRRTILPPDSWLNLVSETSQPLNFWLAEFPIHLRYGFFGNRLQIGGGIVNSLLVGADFNVVSTMDNPYQIDLQGIAIWNAYQRFSVELGYLYGGLNHLAKDRKFGTAAFVHRIAHVGLRYDIGNFKRRSNK
jgi:hypothetical protein